LKPTKALSTEISSTMKLACNGLSFHRCRPDGQEQAVLDSISVEFPPGCTALISGPNGAGKSTLLHILAGLLRPSQGEVLADAAPISRWRRAHQDRFRRRVGFIFQHSHVLIGISAIENVLLPLIPRATTLAEIRQVAQAALDALGIGHLGTVSAAYLSGGERQRVCFARALAADPVAILADEPTSFQDLEGVHRMAAVFKEWRNKGCTVIISGHDPRLSDLPGLIDWRYRLENGRLEVEG
jgi:putative ABC transport system ATP-binding protein